MTVLISGAGICGLTLGLSLHRLGIPFHIYEAVEALRPLGVGINLQPHAARELFELGLEDGLDEIGLRTEEVVYFSAHGQQIWREPRGALAGYDWPQYSLHRGHLQMLLQDRLIAEAGPGCLTTGAAVDGWHDDGAQIAIRLKNRKTGADLGTARGALLVAAEGINSATRAALYPGEGPAKWGGTMMWRGTTRGPRFLTGRSVTMTGEKARKFVAYPIGDLPDGQSLINWIADLALPADYQWRVQDWNRAGRLADFLPRFAGWSFDWLDIPQVIENAESIWEYPMVDRDPLAQWSFGRVTLLGDAAHAMYPIGSNGASQGILDARVLARALRDLGAGPEALAAYEAERRAAVNAVVLANRGDGPDKVLDVVAARAPDGFDRITDVISAAEMAAMADSYKAIAGFEAEALNASAPILEARDG